MNLRATSTVSASSVPSPDAVAPRARAGRLAALFCSGLLALLAAAGCAACQPEQLPSPPAQCDANGKGCLPDEICVEGVCQLREKCEGDDDCPSTAWRCVFPSQICELRPGFGEECTAESPCDPGAFCALGKCRDVASARPCANRSDCPSGQACDRQSFFCIEEAPCTLSAEFPEAACDPGETCDAFSGRCRLPCQEQCTVATQEEDCGPGLLCDGACRCVQCLSDEDCGVGLVCNTRAGRCESEALCFSNDDCEAPLVCDPRTALCQVPPPPCDSDADCTIAEICNRATGACELPGGACSDDRLEDADTPAGAERLNIPAVGADAVLVDDLQLCPDDDDVYALPLLRGEVITARMVGTLPQARATMWLLDSAGETSIAFSETPPRGDGTITYTAQADETVYLRLNALVAATPYDLELSRAQGVACTPDAFEGAGGNQTPATATSAGNVPVGPTLVASICQGDVDYLAVPLAAGEGLEARLVFDGTQIDLDLALEDASTGERLGVSAGLSSPEVLRVRTQAPRTVLVRVAGFGNSVGNYQLTLTRLPPIECAPDAFEPDGDAAAAPVLGIEDAVVGAQRTACVGDADLYKVVLRDFERLVAHAAYVPEDLSLVLEVLDETGATVLSRSPFSAGGATVTYDAADDETVLLRVQSTLNTRGPYTLDVFRENQVDCAPDALEPNDTVAGKSALPDAADVLTVCGTDEDYFAVDGAAGKVLRVQAGFLHADGDLDLMVLGVDGAQILAVSDGVGDGESIEVLLPVDGVYTIRVFSLSSGAKARYSLSAELSTP